MWSLQELGGTWWASCPGFSKISSILIFSTFNLLHVVRDISGLQTKQPRPREPLEARRGLETFSGSHSSWAEEKGPDFCSCLLPQGIFSVISFCSSFWVQSKVELHPPLVLCFCAKCFKTHCVCECSGEPFSSSRPYHPTCLLTECAIHLCSPFEFVHLTAANFENPSRHGFSFCHMQAV